MDPDVSNAVGIVAGQQWNAQFDGLLQNRRSRIGLGKTFRVGPDIDVQGQPQTSDGLQVCANLFPNARLVHSAVILRIENADQIEMTDHLGLEPVNEFELTLEISAVEFIDAANLVCG